MKVVLNTNSNGFSLSREAKNRLLELGIEKEISKMTIPECPEYFLKNSDGTLIEGAYDEYIKRWGKLENRIYDKQFRTNPLLIQVVEELGEKANGNLSYLEIADAPDDVEWSISEYGGKEHIYIVHEPEIETEPTEIEKQLKSIEGKTVEYSYGKFPEIIIHFTDGTEMKMKYSIDINIDVPQLDIEIIKDDEVLSSDILT